VRVDTHTLAVERVRLGDHAFAHYADDDVRWEVPAAFTYRGLARGEKVIVMMDPACSTEDAIERLAAYGGSADEARASGQLVFSSMRDLIRPDKSFTALRQMNRLREETERSCRQGFAGLRTVIDMAWVQDLGTDVEDVMRGEKHANSLFGSRRYAEICAYDRRCFDPGVVEEMRLSHPVALLERPGDLQAHHAPGELYLIGDADVVTGDILRAAVSLAFDAPRGRRALVDLTRLCFLSAGCAGDLLRLIGHASACEKVVVRCRPPQARILRRLRAMWTDRLELEETGDDR
jgi:MEDS: MEthanogen/methylotroph, DcmR Sensory domain